MKVFIILLPLVASCFAGEGGYNPSSGTQRGLLVLPKQVPASSSSARYEQEQQQKNSYNQQQQAPEILNPEFAERRGVYFVEVPQERIEALQGYHQQVSQQSRQNFQTSGSAQYNQQENFPVNVRYLPLEDSPAQFQSAALSSQYNQQPSAEVVVRYLPVPLTEQTGQYSQQERASGNLASVQYSEVQPIQGPVYSYQPDAVTRILRYAPVY